MHTYEAGDTAFIVAENRLFNIESNTWVLQDADNGYPKITIVDSSGEKIIDEQQMNRVDTGKYIYAFDIPSNTNPGIWSGYVDTQNLGMPERTLIGFRVR